MRRMWTSPVISTWLTGFTVCLSLIASIGAQNIYVLRQAVNGRHIYLCVAWCVLADTGLIGLGVAGMVQLKHYSFNAEWLLSLGGALFLLAYGLFALRRALFAAGKNLSAVPSTQPGALGVLFPLILITLLNPHVYLDTVLLIGAVGARQQNSLQWIFVFGAASASLAWFLALTLAGRRLQSLFAKPTTWRMLDAFTGALMLGLAWWVWPSESVNAPMPALTSTSPFHERIASIAA